MRDTLEYPTQCPPVRLPRGRHAIPCSHAPAAYQVGRIVRARLLSGCAPACIALGWALFFTLIPLSADAGNTAACIALLTGGCALFGFGIGWMVRGEIGGRR